jgi:adenylate kinase family enzyme
VPTTQSFPLGRRIAVRGVTGSGKSTIARELGAALGLKVIELDAIHWQREGWQPLPADEFRSRLRDVLTAATEGWVIEGNYPAVADLYLDQVDTLVWIHLPWRVTFWRVLKRTLGRSLKGELLWGTQRESLRQAFFSKNSILWWSTTNHRRANGSIAGMIQGMSGVRVYEMKTSSDIAGLLDAARRQGPAAGVAYNGREVMR